MRIEDGFQPIPFSEQNVYTSDPVLPGLLKRSLPTSIFKEIEQDLARLGTEVITTIRPLSDSFRAHPPTLVQYDQWGQRIDHLHTSEAWRELKAISQREGIPAIFYERRYKEYSRTYGFAKVALLDGDTNMIFCPMAMADGTARVIELMGSPKMKEEIFPRLISRDPALAFTSGQWMTERPGGSDISQTETVAHPTDSNHKYGPRYILNGVKWFSSATDSDISVVLARTGSLKDGSRMLSLFLVPLCLPLLLNPSDPISPRTSNNILVHRLKNKIGTHILPTAELNLESAEGYLIGSLGQGVKNISPVLNITRLWSAMSSIGKLRKCLAIATSYAKVRVVRTLPLKDTPIHVEQLASVTLLYQALTHLAFGIIGLLGKAECGTATPDELRRLRMLTPVVKGYAAEKACTGMEEAMTAMGGAGYMEENGFGRAIRDSLVEKIWEGTIVIMALDLIRSAYEPETMKAFISWTNSVMESCPEKLEEQVVHALAILKEAIEEFAPSFQQPMPPLVPRPALMLAGVIASSVYLLEHAIWSFTTNEESLEVDIEIFKRRVIEGDTVTSIASVRRAKKHSVERVEINSTIVFGSPTRSKL